MDNLEKLKIRVEQSPKNELFRFSYAKALLDLNRHEDALPHLQFCLSKKPDWMVVVMLLGKINLEIGNKTLSREYYGKALDLALVQKHEGPESEIREILKNIS